MNNHPADQRDSFYLNGGGPTFRGSRGSTPGTRADRAHSIDSSLAPITAALIAVPMAVVVDGNSVAGGTRCRVRVASVAQWCQQLSVDVEPIAVLPAIVTILGVIAVYFLRSPSSSPATALMNHVILKTIAVVSLVMTVRRAFEGCRAISGLSSTALFSRCTGSYRSPSTFKVEEPFFSVDTVFPRVLRTDFGGAAVVIALGKIRTRLLVAASIVRVQHFPDDTSFPSRLKLDDTICQGDVVQNIVLIPGTTSRPSSLA